MHLQEIWKSFGNSRGGVKVFHKSSGSLLVITFMLTATTLGGLHILSRSVLYASIGAVSELVRFRVVRPLIATIALTDATVVAAVEGCAGLGSADPYLFTGLLQPSQGAIVTYRTSPDWIAIQIEGGRPVRNEERKIAATLQFAAQPDCEIFEPLTIRMKRRQPGLDRPLPIAGPADIGKEFGVPPMPSSVFRGSDMMWEGHVKVFSRTYFTQELVPVADAEFPLPVGGRLSGGDNLDPRAPVDPEIAAWYGTVTLDDRGFVISATTISQNLQLYRPGTGKDEMEKLGLGILASAFSDPVVVLATSFVLIFTTALGSVASWMGFWRESERKDQP